jgi:hypothetical protein
MPQPRLTRAQLADHLFDQPAAIRRVALALRATVLKAAPAAAEAIKFRVLCYYHDDAFFKSIGGNICMIELRSGRKPGVMLSFIHGALLADPDRLLQGRAKFKRSLPIPDAKAAADPRIAALIRAAAKLRPWD